MIVVGAAALGLDSQCVSGSWACPPLLINSEMVATNSWYPQGSGVQSSAVKSLRNVPSMATKSPQS